MKMRDLTKIIPPTRRGKLYAVILVIACCALAYYLWQQLKQSYDAWFPILIGGVLASLVATLISTYVYSKEVWSTDVKEVNERLVRVETELAHVKQECNTFLGGLPRAIGGEFTKSLFRFYPNTSARIAEILSIQAADLYNRHCDRVAVMNCTETYRLTDIKSVSLGSNTYNVWTLDFHCVWTWQNDSQRTQYPLKDFLIFVSAPDVALPSFEVGIGTIDQGTRRSELQAILRGRNYVRTIVEHPERANQRIDEDAAIDAMCRIAVLSVKSSGTEKQDFHLEQLECISKDKLPLLMYRGYRLPKTITDFPLEISTNLVVEYHGQLTIPVRMSGVETPSKISGTIMFPPSDVIAGRYVLNLLYSKAKVTIDEEESGCWFVHDKTKNFDLNSGDLNDLPSGFQPRNGEALARLCYEEPLTHLHRIWIIWHADKEMARQNARGGESLTKLPDKAMG